MIDLPTSPGPADASVSLMDFGGLLTPSLGGPVQRIDRLGNRCRLTVTLPPMRFDLTGRQWLQRLIRGKTEGARTRYPLLGFDPGAPGAPVVDGADQAGRTLSLRGCTPNYGFKEAQPFSVVSGGRHHLYFVDTPAIASASGTVTLAVSPMLRTSPADGDEAHVGTPMIEGFIEGSEFAWQMSLGNFIGLQFAIREAR